MDADPTPQHARVHDGARTRPSAPRIAIRPLRHCISHSRRALPGGIQNSGARWLQNNPEPAYP
jgi:hypothetical protein